MSDDKIEQIQPTATAPEKAQEPMRTESKPAPEKRAFVSAGEKIHKWGTYLSVDWIFNAASGVAFAYWGKYTETGKKWWSGNVNKMFETILKPFLKGETLKKSVGHGNTFMSIIAGGMFTLPPLMLLENKKNKKAIVHSLDSMIYGKETVENDPKFQQAYKEIDNEPKKDFATGMTSRFAALAPLLGLVLFPPTSKFLKREYFGRISDSSKKLAHTLGIKEEKVFKKFSAQEAKERWNYCHDDALAMDLGFGLPYAGLHAVFYNMFAKSKDSKKQKAAEAVAELPPPLEAASDIATAVVDTIAKGPAPSHAARELARQSEEKSPALSA
jgi:hypothetical protein